MSRSPIRRALALAIAGTALFLGTATVTAKTPSVQSWTVHIERPYADCSDFTVLGIWEIHHKLTFFYDSSGVAIRDIEQVDFTGRLVNTTTGAWIADSGSKTFFDTLAPDGSFLTTYQVTVRHSQYVHTAGRWDFQTGEFRGHDGEDAEGIAGLCAALAG